MVCVGLQQFAEFAAFFSVPASSRKFRPLATNQKVGSSNLSGRSHNVQSTHFQQTPDLPLILGVLAFLSTSGVSILG